MLGLALVGCALIPAGDRDDALNALEIGLAVVEPPADLRACDLPAQSAVTLEAGTSLLGEVVTLSATFEPVGASEATDLGSWTLSPDPRVQPLTVPAGACGAGCTGVQIEARPPGKQPRTLDLLSGGEKALTAVSLIFAIFLIKPSPFCILDEVDAPLDDANVGRFTSLVREGKTHQITSLISELRSMKSEPCWRLQQGRISDPNAI